MLRSPVKSSGTVDAVTIDERQRRHPEPRRLAHERLRLLRPLQKRERRLRVQLDEHVLLGATVWLGAPDAQTPKRSERPGGAEGAPR